MSRHRKAKVRIGLVGAGFVARIHAEAYRRVHGVEVELRGVAAAHRRRAATFAEEFGVARVYDDAEALLAEGEIDLVDVCVPPYLHAPITIAAARAGKHVIVEKPLTGYFGPAPLAPDDGEQGSSSVGAIDRATVLEGALANADAMLDAVRQAGVSSATPRTGATLRPSARPTACLRPRKPSYCGSLARSRTAAPTPSRTGTGSPPAAAR